MRDPGGRAAAARAADGATAGCRPRPRAGLSGAGGGAAAGGGDRGAPAPAGGAAAPPDIPAGRCSPLRGAEIPVWDLADLGVRSTESGAPIETLRYGRPRPARPRLHPDRRARLRPCPRSTASSSSWRDRSSAAKAASSSKPAEEIVEESSRPSRTRAGSTTSAARRPAVIPLAVSAARPVRLEPATGGDWRVVCESPLSCAHRQRGRRPAAETGAPRRAPSPTSPPGSAWPRSASSRCASSFRRRGLLEVGRAAGDPAFAPTVTVIVPTLDRADDLDDCLAALGRP